MLNDAQRGFLDRSRVAHLATADRHGAPHLVPVCFCVDGLSLYITVDEKPKRIDIPLKRLRNIQENPAVAVTVDRWDEDWTRLGWIMLRGPADILAGGEEHDRAQAMSSPALSAIPGDGPGRAARYCRPDTARAVMGCIGPRLTYRRAGRRTLQGRTR